MITIAAWIYPPSGGANGYGRIVHKRDDIYGTPSFLLDGSANALRVEYRSTVNSVWNSPNSSIIYNQWQHVAMTYDNSLQVNDPVMYINGSRVVINDASPSGPPDADDNKLWIGNRSDLARAFDGVIDDVRIYDRVLSHEEIVDLAAVEFEVTTPETSAVSPAYVEGISSHGVTVSVDGGVSFSADPVPVPSSGAQADRPPPQSCPRYR